jgi:hypothetical protein
VGERSSNVTGSVPLNHCKVAGLTHEPLAITTQAVLDFRVEPFAHRCPGGSVDATDAQFRSVEEALQRRFAGRVPADEIAHEVELARRKFERSRVNTYVPVLVQREVDDRLRRRT